MRHSKSKGKFYCDGCGYSLNYETGLKTIRISISGAGNTLCCRYRTAVPILDEIILTELYRELMRRGELIKQ